MQKRDAMQPLLTIAIPTYNRAVYLRELLEQLLPQLAAVAADGHAADVGLLICDNASTDNTAEVTRWAQSTLAVSGVVVDVQRQPENIGSDRNFIDCWNRAHGRYFWLLGDDDIVHAGGVDHVLQVLRAGEYDLAFLDPVAFYRDWRAEFRPDPKDRADQVVTSGMGMARLINVGITFISGYIVNRERVLALGVEPPEAFAGTALVQLSWSLPLLRQHRQSIALWQRHLSGRAMNSGGYNIADVFGDRFFQVVERLLPDQPKLASVFRNAALRRWFPNTVMELRRNGKGGTDVTKTSIGMSGAEKTLRRLFGRNPRFWLFTWPTLHLPLPLAGLYLRGANFASRIIDWTQKPRG